MGEVRSVMIVGSGAREHALSAAYERSGQIEKIIVAPGNDFMAFDREKEVVIEKDAKLSDAQSFLRIAQRHEPDLVDVAQDDALAAGTVDLLQKNGFKVFGPRRDAARLEWDKAWSRAFMAKYGIPAPAFQSFDDPNAANDYVKQQYAKNPAAFLYIKASGLCAGKGALFAQNENDALKRVSEMSGFGEAGKNFVIEEGMTGEEFSYYAISDGNTYAAFRSAQDNKRALNFDEGEQTGGMGVIAPVSITAGAEKTIEETLVAPVIAGMQKEGAPYTGILYVGGMNTPQGLRNVEYNARWGDPEAQAIIPGITTDYADIAQACMNGELERQKIEQDDMVRVCVVGASRGYPGDYSAVKGKRIFGLERAMVEPHVKVFGAGIEVRDGQFFAKGGRLFSIVGEGKDLLEARSRAYAAIAHVSIEDNNLHYRTDIGWRDVERMLKEK